MLCPAGTGHNPLALALSQRRELNGILKIVCYGNRLSVQPGQVIRFMVSCVVPRYWTGRHSHFEDAP